MKRTNKKYNKGFCDICALTLLALLIGFIGSVPIASAQPQSAGQTSKQTQAKPIKSISSQNRLEAAYKREFAFLEAEKRTLTTRIKQSRQSTETRLREAKNQVAGLQGQVVNAASEAERLEELLLAAERDIDTMQESEDVTGDILIRAESVLKKVGISLPKADTTDRASLIGQFEFVFEKAPAALAVQSSVRTQDGQYFGLSGTKVEGQILRIGDIASYGLAADHRGPLAPAGEGRLKLWPADTGSAAATALLEKKAISHLPVFLYEALEKGIEPKADKSILDIIRTGGIIAWVIVALGFVALLMILIRCWLLARASKGRKGLLAAVLKHVDGGENNKALDIASQNNTPTGRVVSQTLSHIGKTRGQVEDAVAEAILQEQPLLSRFGSGILMLAAVSPLLGLLGTVTGMISTFDVITEFGTGNPKLLSGGISEALVTTELGLIVAIPSLVIGQILSGWSESIRDHLDGSALAVINRSENLQPPTEDEVSNFNGSDPIGHAA